MLNKVNKKIIIRCAIITGGAAIFVLLLILLSNVIGIKNMNPEESKAPVELMGDRRVPKLDYKVDLLDVNKYSRPGIRLKKVNAVVVHYVSNPGTDAKDNRDYFNNLPSLNEGKKTPRFASAHFVIGLEGNILQCIPLSEMAYASNDRNSDTIAIECCHPKKDGKFSKKTMDSLTDTLAYLCIRYGLDPTKDIIRHYDVTGKMCPKYYVKHPEAWLDLIEEAAKKTEEKKKAVKSGEEPYDLFDHNGEKIGD